MSDAFASFRVDVDPDARPISGFVTRCGGERTRFVGWIGLGALLEAAAHPPETTAARPDEPAAEPPSA